jgi:orotate phosphoribosyltransferase
MNHTGSKNTAAAAFVKYALRTGALELILEGRPLKSGRISPYFFNSGLFNTGEAIDQLSAAYSDVVTEKFGELNGEPVFDVLYGPPYKGTILVPVIASAQNTFGFGNIRFCTSRKEAKGHGEGGLMIGSPIKPGDRVLIIDDVITDGGTKRDAVELITSEGGIPMGLVIAFDRQERGSGELSAAQEFTRDFGIPVYAAATLADLINVLEHTLEHDDEQLTDQEQFAARLMLDKIYAYQKEYGVS